MDGFYDDIITEIVSHNPTGWALVSRRFFAICKRHPAIQRIWFQPDSRGVRHFQLLTTYSTTGMADYLIHQFTDHKLLLELLIRNKNTQTFIEIHRRGLTPNYDMCPLACEIGAREIFEYLIERADGLSELCIAVLARGGNTPMMAIARAKFQNLLPRAN